MKKDKGKFKEGWTVDDVYNIKWTDGGTFYMPPTYTCKEGGYTFEGLNTCGSRSIFEYSTSKMDEAKAVDHVLRCHK